MNEEYTLIEDLYKRIESIINKKLNNKINRISTYINNLPNLIIYDEVKDKINSIINEED